MIIVKLMLAVFCLLTVYFVRGKGGWLISGYNALSKEEKAEYDEALLCRWVGYALLLPLDLMLLLIMLQKSERLILAESAVFTLYTIGIILFANTKGIGKVNH